jgi:hypothetical protein
VIQRVRRTLPKEAAVSKNAMPQHLACSPDTLRYVCRRTRKTLNVV